MGTITYQIPASGSEQNATADPKISTALQTLLTWANGNVDTANIAATLAAAAGVNQSGQTVKGFSSITATDALTNTTYQLAAHNDVVSGIVLPTSGLLRVTARVHLDKTVGTGAVWTGLFLNGAQIASPFGNANAGNAANCEISVFSGTNPTIAAVVGTGGTSSGEALYGTSGAGDPSDVYGTRGQAIGSPIAIAAPAGTYTVSLQYKVDSGVTASVTSRLLYVVAESYA